jgi:hypothetical protein
MTTPAAEAPPAPAMPAPTLPVPQWSRPLALLIAGFALFEMFYLARYFIRQPVDNSLFGDFFAFWAYAHFIQALPAVEIYDLETLQAFELAMPGGFDAFYPCVYPPILLLLVWPLGALGYLPAYGVWMSVTFAAYLAAVAWGDWRSPRLWLALSAPSSVLEIISGENGFLTAALMIGGFRLMGRWPFLGGVLVGGLAFKPQFLVLVPVVLLAGRRWRSLAGLTASVLGLVTASAAAFGPSIWLRWLQTAPRVSPLFAENLPRYGHLEPSVFASSIAAHLDYRLASVLQLLSIVAVVACLALVFRRGAGLQAAPRPLDVAALQVGVFLATPYAFIYDLPMVTSAVATTIERCTEAARPWRQGEATVLVFGLLLPLAMFSGTLEGWPVGPIEFLLLLAVIVRAGWSLPPGETPALFSRSGRT